MSAVPVAEPQLPREWRWWALVPVLAGALLPWSAQGPWQGLLSLLPALLLIASGASLWLWPGEPRVLQFMAGGGVLALLAGLLGLIAAHPLFLLVGVVGGTVSYLVAGRVALGTSPAYAGVPPAPLDVRTCAKVALDEALLSYFVASVRLPMGADAAALAEGAGSVDTALRAARAYEDPGMLHPAPPAPADAVVRPAPWGEYPFERLTFDSGFVRPETLPMPPWAPGKRNPTMHAWVCRQPHSARPWLLCIHGYRMGFRFVDFRLFPPAELYRAFGVNMVLPVLPLHGARREGLQSGDHYLDGHAIDLLYVQSQALWDLRRTVAWIREQEPGARIGVLGYSLGGYNAALLAAHEPGLDFVVAGIPVADFGSTLWSLVPPYHKAVFVHGQLDAKRYSDVLTPVSPLARRPQLDSSRLAVFAGTCDRVVPPEQPLRLAEHWGVSVDWYPGAHLTFRGEPAVESGLRRVMGAAGWLSPPRSSAAAASAEVEVVQDSKGSS